MDGFGGEKAAGGNHPVEYFNKKPGGLVKWFMSGMNNYTIMWGLHKDPIFETTRIQWKVRVFVFLWLSCT